jgi:hypothetical protein
MYLLIISQILCKCNLINPIMSDEGTAIRKDSRKTSERGSHWKIENRFILVAERMSLRLYPGFASSVVLRERQEENYNVSMPKINFLRQGSINLISFN